MTDDVDIRAANVLDDAAELLTDPRRWTRHTEARDAVGASTHPKAEDAQRWCVGGAVVHVGNKDLQSFLHASDALRQAATDRGWRHHQHANDKGSYGEVLAVLNQARSQLRQEGQT
jgi:hypothetical protein